MPDPAGADHEQGEAAVDERARASDRPMTSWGLALDAGRRVARRADAIRRGGRRRRRAGLSRRAGRLERQARGEAAAAPGSLSTVSTPPWCSTMRTAMASRPVPAKRRRTASPRANGWKSVACSAG